MNEAPNIDASIYQPLPEAQWSGTWRERIGEQRMKVRASHNNDEGLTYRVAFENRYGFQLGDNRTIEMRLTREGATILRDALDAALKWDGRRPSPGDGK